MMQWYPGGIPTFRSDSYPAADSEAFHGGLMDLQVCPTKGAHRYIYIYTYISGILEAGKRHLRLSPV